MRTLASIFALGLVIFFLGAGVALVRQDLRPSVSRAAIRSRLSTLNLALSYYERRLTFNEHTLVRAPAYSVTVEGQPKLSWTVYLLPYLDQSDESFRMDEVWNSRANLEAAQSTMPSVYARNDSNPSDRQCAFIAIVDDRADDVVPRILGIAECPSMDLWTVPRVARLSKLQADLDSCMSNGGHILLNDGRICYFKGTPSWQEAKKLLQSANAVARSEKGELFEGPSSRND